MFPSKMVVYRNMFALIMLDRISRYIGNTEVVTVEAHRGRKRNAKVIKQLTNPDGLGNCIANCPILSLSRRLRNGGLFLRAPGK